MNLTLLTGDARLRGDVGYGGKLIRNRSESTRPGIMPPYLSKRHSQWAHRDLVEPVPPTRTLPTFYDQ